MNGNQTSLLIAAALIWKDGELLLVKQQGPDDAAPSWALPGGVVAKGELLSQALVREVREETGLTVKKLGPLLFVTQTINEATGHCFTSFVFEIRAWEGVPNPQDPDALIQEARFMSIEKALTRLAQLPWRVMREPIMAYLRGTTSSDGFWGYRAGPDEQVFLVECPSDWRVIS